MESGEGGGSGPRRPQCRLSPQCSVAEPPRCLLGPPRNNGPGRRRLRARATSCPGTVRGRAPRIAFSSARACALRLRRLGAGLLPPRRDFLEEFPETDEPVWILGKQHHLKADKSKLLLDISARLWFTYRRKFSPIGGTGPSSDAGWGCMLRCGQMMLAQALICRHLGREKMCWSPPQSSSAAYGSMHSHRSALGRNKNTAGFCSGWKPLLLIIPLRLGINHINPIYIEAFKECFKMPQSLGALGGKPNNAYYFIGFLGNELIYLDPHTTQIFVDSEENGMVDDQSFHCQQAPHRMKIMNLDPSVALGFFCKEEKDFDNWCSLVQKEILKQQSLRMFELVQKHPPHWPPFIPPTKPEVTTTGAELIESTDKLFELEEEFEILSV
ncbi:cysteine protease ATG4A isoform X5 [Alligator sinensis]|uniref:Cysteine protease n=2 Tax=Alligator sinensis TaxID=38654 RepID=A0A3Q0HHP0_ALLSI|nr:cysteine protease ATG4A isoform X5 [Alligator sinensis]